MSESSVQLQWAYGNKRQAAYATEMAAVDVNQSHPFVAADFGDHAPHMSDNAALYGKGHEFATRNEVLSWSTSFKRQFQATSKIVGWGFAFHCGQVTTTPLGGSPACYRHVMTYMNPITGSGYYGSPRQQPVTTVYELVTSGMVRVFPSVQVMSVEITGQIDDWILANMELMGSGMYRRIAPSAFSFPDPTDESTGGEGSLLRFAALTFTHGVSGATADVSCDVRKFRFASNMAYFDKEGYCPGSGFLVSGNPHSGQIRNKLEIDKRTVVLEFEIRAAADQTYFDRLDQQTTVTGTFDITGDSISGGNSHQLKIEIPQMRYTAVPIGTDGDLIVYQITAMVFYDNTLANPFRVTVVNKTSAYLGT